MKGRNRKRKVKQAKHRAPKPYRRKSSAPLKKIAGYMVILIAAVLLGGAGGMAVRWVHTTVLQSKSFAVNEIVVFGNSHVDQEVIIKHSRLKKGSNIFTVDLEGAAIGVKSHPWVKGVTVKRRFPDKIIIHVVERTATAVVRQRGLRLMDPSGEVFKSLDPGDPVDMPVVTGPNGTDAILDDEVVARLLRVMELARESGTMPENNISEIVVSSDGGIDLIGVDEPRYVNLGGADIERRWFVLEIVVADARRSGAEVYGVDLRYKDGAALKLKDGPRTLVADGGSVTESGNEQ